MTDEQEPKARAPAPSPAPAAYVEDGAFEAELARRVAFKHREPAAARQPARAATATSTRRWRPRSQRLGFTTRIYDNPLPGQGPVLLATRIEDAKLPTVLGYGHGDVIRGLEDQWTKGKGPWVTARDGDRALRPRHRRQQGPAHPQHGGPRRACATERGGKPRLQRQVHHRDGRGGGLQGPGRAGGGAQGGLRRRRPDRLRRPARASRSGRP